MIHVIALITAKPGKREEILKHARANLAAVRAEKGCIEYGPVVDAGVVQELAEEQPGRAGSDDGDLDSQAARRSTGCGSRAWRCAPSSSRRRPPCAGPRRAP